MLKKLKGSSRIENYSFIAVDDYQHLKDEQIIDLILSGKKQVFEVIMRRYNQRLYRVQRSYISDEESLKDTLQSTYIKVFEHLNSFRGDSKFSTWITRIAINEALKFVNKHKQISKLHLLKEKQAMYDDRKNQLESPEEVTIQKDFKKLLEQVVDELPPKYRAVYLMREIENMNTGETAECLNISESNVKVRLHRGKKMIQDLINKEFTETEIFGFLGKRCDQIVFNVMRTIGL